MNFWSYIPHYGISAYNSPDRSAFNSPKSDFERKQVWITPDIWKSLNITQISCIRAPELLMNLVWWKKLQLDPHSQMGGFNSPMWKQAEKQNEHKIWNCYVVKHEAE